MEGRAQFNVKRICSYGDFAANLLDTLRLDPLVIGFLSLDIQSIGRIAVRCLAS